MRWILLAAIIIAALVLWCREILAVGAGRREGQDHLALYRRLRRRSKGLLLLIILYILAAFYDDFRDLGSFRARETVLYSGMTLVCMFWALILASRDLKETAHEALEARRRLADETIKGVEDLIAQRQAKRREQRDKS